MLIIFSTIKTRVTMKDTTIENRFFAFYEFNGIVHKSIDYIRQHYTLNPYDDEVRPLQGVWIEYYNKTLPDEIVKEYGENAVWFDDMTVRPNGSPLIDEIEGNVNSCTTQQEIDRYIFTLLKPFKEFCDLLNPTAIIERCNTYIDELKASADRWGKHNPDELLKDTVGRPAGTPREQIAACNSEIERYRKQIERLRYVANTYVDLLCTDRINNNSFTKGTVEYCLSAMLGTMGAYSNRLYAMLIQHGIDIKPYQDKAGIYLKTHWLITDIDLYIGSIELARYYIDQLPKYNPPQRHSDTAAPGTPTPQPLTRHYNSTLTDEQLNKMFSTLTNNGYLAADSDLQGWLWICTGKGEKTATEPLKWIGKQNTLAEFANWICGSNSPTDWETTAACFVLSTGSKPNINAMKQHKIAEKEKTKLLNLLKTAAQQKEK